MDTKSTTKTHSKTSKISDSNIKTTRKKSQESKDATKKVIVKRRKTDLMPTRASAVAIASQANRAKKEALIEKFATSEVRTNKDRKQSNDTKIPSRVWIFFGCSLFLFCISFYKAIIFPQLEGNTIDNTENIERISLDSQDNLNQESDIDLNSEVISQDEIDNQGINISESATEIIEEFFNRLSNRQFDDASNLLIPALRNTPEIRDHFTSFRMNPFLDGIEGGMLTPTNFQYVSTSSFGRDKYSFDLSYVLKSDQERYDETWEFVVDTKGDSPRITSIVCTTSKCSYHPIFWPEKFGLMK